MSYTMMDPLAELAKIAKLFDKDINKIQVLLKNEKDKKKKATLEKDLVQLKADKSKAQGEKLLAMQKKNADEANQLFDLIQRAFITAGTASGKAQKAYAAFTKTTTDRGLVDEIRSAYTSIQDLPDQLDKESQAFVKAQGDLRGSPMLTELDPKDTAPFKKLRDKLQGDNMAFAKKIAAVRSILSQLDTMLKTAEDLSAKGTKHQDQLRDNAAGQLGKAQDLLKRLAMWNVEHKARRIIESANSDDPSTLTTAVTMGKELIAGDKAARDDLKSIKAFLDAVEKLLANIVDNKALLVGLGDARKQLAERAKALQAAADLEKQALTAAIEAKKKLK